MHPYVVFEGLIGAGKTTLATALSECVEADLLLEEFANNDFLPSFYDDCDRWALPMQLSFLLSRHRTSKSFPYSRHRPLIADFSYSKERIFADLLLASRREHELYCQISTELEVQLPTPDVTILVDADDKILLQRIRLRRRQNEATIDAHFLKRLRSSYESNYASSQANVLRYDTSVEDFDKPENLRLLISKINAALSSNFTPLVATRKVP